MVDIYYNTINPTTKMTRIKVDLTNRKFNYLTAIKSVPKPTNNLSKQFGTWWECRCDCGNIKNVRSRELIVGDTKSCGCKNKFESSSKYKGCGRVSQTFYSKLVRGAKSRNFEVAITKEFLWNLFLKQQGRCYYTRLPIELNARDCGTETTASVDRIDSRLGYTENNIVWVHKDINIMKNVFSNDHFLNLCSLVVANQNVKESFGDSEHD